MSGPQVVPAMERWYEQQGAEHKRAGQSPRPPFQERYCVAYWRGYRAVKGKESKS